MKTTAAKPMSQIERYILLTFGVLLTAVGVYFFKFPNNFSTGGVSGLSLILGRVLPSPVLTPSAFVFIINMALLVVGGSIRLSALKNDLPLLMRLCGVKLLLMPAIWAAMGIAAGLPAEQLVTLIIVGAMPAAVNVYIITDKMGGDGALACSAVVVTHLMSLFTMTAIIFAMRTARLI